MAIDGLFIRCEWRRACAELDGKEYVVELNRKEHGEEYARYCAGHRVIQQRLPSLFQAFDPIKWKNALPNPKVNGRALTNCYFMMIASCKCLPRY